MKLYRRLLIPGLVAIGAVLVLQGCGTARVKPGLPAAEPASENIAAKALREGEYVFAAREFGRLAETVAPPARQDYQLKAVDALIKAGQTHEAKKQIRTIEVDRLAPDFEARRLIALALIASQEGAHIRAIRLLDRAGRPRGLSPQLYGEIFRIKAEAEQTLGNPIAAVNNLIRAEQYLVEDIAKDQNQMAIWEILGPLSLATLKHEQLLARDPALAGWLQLAIIYAEDPRQFSREARAWKKANPKHPVTDTTLRTLASPAPRFIGRVDRIALLLPLSSKYSRWAKPVRDGFMAMHALDGRPDKPSVSIYDIGEEPQDVKHYYATAVREGAQLVVGPMGREAVDYLVKRGNLTVPTVLLSHTDEDTDFTDSAVFQFGLTPEQEAIQAAERAYLDGRRQAAVLYPATAWGQRMYGAFSNHWQRLGGIILAERAYDPKQTDFSEPIKEVLNVRQSEARKRALEIQLKTRLNFSPRRRQDIDCIFLAADARNGRLIKPQLNYHHAADIPVYSTSQIFTGKRDRIYDADLDGIMFGDMPWMLVEDGAISRLQQAQAGRPYANHQLDRLYALGMDSYAMIPHLNRISAESAIRFNGVTSSLSVDQWGQLQRQLLWARFRRGVPRMIDTYFKYSGQFELQDGAAYSAAPPAGS